MMIDVHLVCVTCKAQEGKAEKIILPSRLRNLRTMRTWRPPTGIAVFYSWRAVGQRTTLPRGDIVHGAELLMPIVDGKDISPDEAIHRGLCPECGVPLTPKSALSHALGHWDRPNLSPEGRRRYDLVLEFIDIAKPRPRPKITMPTRPTPTPPKPENDRLAEFLGLRVPRSPRGTACV
jgi:hypothetical protein